MVHPAEPATDLAGWRVWWSARLDEMRGCDYLAGMRKLEVAATEALAGDTRAGALQGVVSLLAAPKSASPALIALVGRMGLAEAHPVLMAHLAGDGWLPQAGAGGGSTGGLTSAQRGAICRALHGNKTAAALGAVHGRVVFEALMRARPIKLMGWLPFWKWGGGSGGDGGEGELPFAFSPEEQADADAQESGVTLPELDALAALLAASGERPHQQLAEVWAGLRRHYGARAEG